MLNDDYDEDYTDYLDGTLDGTYNGAMYDIWPKSRGSHPYLEAAFEMQVFAGKPNTTDDVYTFTAPAAAQVSLSATQEDMEKIRVVPNPYYGYHSGELNPFERWVQFTFLPAQCTVRIFDLAGNMVRKLEKNDPDTPYIQWDLENEFELPVASGIYIYHVSAPQVGEIIGKMAIFAPNERLDTY
jgi:hypothetical protein